MSSNFFEFGLCIGDEIQCPVCLSKFKVSNDTKYIARHSYVCSWKCFLNAEKNGNDHSIDRIETVHETVHDVAEPQVKRKRGRPRKNGV